MLVQLCTQKSLQLLSIQLYTLKCERVYICYNLLKPPVLVCKLKCKGQWVRSVVKCVQWINRQYPHPLNN